ncbi:cinnamoyl-CoA reductase 1-like [Aristolochia californica]|uniref:cinnamoyl-CoA reductase 1-like n=1 Tax=Aristolochia californica TaxID=171875 RepID=UPI0035D5CD28
MIEVESSTDAAHLKKLDHAPENLQLFRAELLAYVSLGVANAGCAGVFHVASPFPPGSVPNPEIDLIEPVVTGTLNAPKTLTEAPVRQVIVVTSPFAVPMPTTWPNDKILDETCWSNKVYCRTTRNCYCLAKTAAASEALEYGHKHNIQRIVDV